MWPLHSKQYKAIVLLRLPITLNIRPPVSQYGQLSVRTRSQAFAVSREKSLGNGHFRSPWPIEPQRGQVGGWISVTDALPAT